ncbi:MAG: hypothetical protein GVY22_06995 [Gammaproteobacteria bacterium]|jgi:hypothetical protein|nr:hypothetical protein [Gammaproteobacteria bacterium]
MTTKKTLTAAAFALALGAGSANAALLSITGGNNIGAPPSDNDILNGNTPPGTAGGFLTEAATLATTQANVLLEFFYWGSESGYENTLVTAFDSHTETGGTGSNLVDNGYLGANLVASGVQTSAGQVTLSFNIDFDGDGTTDATADQTTVDPGIGFAFLDPSTGNYSGSDTGSGFVFLDSNVVLITLDDGADVDDNHDDYVGYVRASVVPIPAAAWLFGSALVGMAGIGYRRSRRT